MSMNDIRTAIKNATGPRAALFIPEASFEQLVKRQIKRLEEPSLQCIELVYDELQRIVAQLEGKELMRFSNLRERVVEVVNQLLQKCRFPTRDMISNLINIELAYINTNHPDFVGGGGAINSVFQRMAQNHMLEQQQQQQLQYQQMQQPPQLPPQNQPQPQPQPERKPTAKAPATRTTSNPTMGGPAPGGNQQPGSNGFFNMFFAPGSNQPQPMTQNMPQQEPAFTAAPAKSRTKIRKSTSSKSAVSSSGLKAEKLDQVPTTIKAINNPSEKEKFETELIQSLLVSYFDIVRKNVQDSVPKSIMHFLVNQAKDTIQNELVAHLYKEELFDQLLEESSMVAARRSACKNTLEILRKAQTVLNEVRETAL